jgi:hypothetical protein
MLSMASFWAPCLAAGHASTTVATKRQLIPALLT